MSLVTGHQLLVTERSLVGKIGGNPSRRFEGSGGTNGPTTATFSLPQSMLCIGILSRKIGWVAEDEDNGTADGYACSGAASGKAGIWTGCFFLGGH